MHEDVMDIIMLINKNYYSFKYYGIDPRKISDR